MPSSSARPRGVFARFLHRQHGSHRFRRLPWWGHAVGGPAHRQAAAQVGGSLRGAARLAPEAALAHWHSSAEGLTEAQAHRVRHRCGPNQVGTEGPLPWPLHLWQAYRSPFSLLLTALAIVSWLTQDLRSAVVILAMVTLATGMRFVQERRSNRAADALKAMVSSQATVLRPGHGPQELPMAQLVPGDVVTLSAGDMVPADARVLSAKDLFINQAAMTGESLPVEKHTDIHAEVSDPLTLDNLVFMGTNVVSGSATVLVVATGPHTFFGALAGHAASTERPPTQFEAGINQVSRLLLRWMAVMVPAVLLFNGWGHGNWLEAFLFALSVAVGLTPEMLPMIVTSTLAKGAVAMAKRQVIVKRLDAIQNLGAMDVLCTDKTGTLTQDHIALSHATDARGRPDDGPLRWAWLNSQHQTGLHSPMDRALLARSDLGSDCAGWRKLDEVPFDFQRRRMSVVLQPPDGGAARLICKGAVEEMLACCSAVTEDGAPQPLTPERLDTIRAAADHLNGEGLRVVAVAWREVPAQGAYHVADETGLTLAGFVAFLDPPKDSTAPALQALAAHGVTVKVLTGDSDAVTRKVCAQVGLNVTGVLLGPQVAALDDTALQAAVREANVFAKLAPQDKERIVHALRAQGHVVGFMGDGINDAPALHAADVGISVDTGVDIAKEVADIILLEKSLLVLDAGVLEGRKTFANMLKYIKMAASSNFGNVLSVLVASLLLPFLPMLPMHLLVQNLLYDFSQAAVPFDRVDADLLTQPQRWNPDELGRFMLTFGPISSIFDLATFALMWWGYGAQSPAQQTLFQSGWFVESLLTQTLVVHLIRSPRLPFIGSRAAPALLTTTGALALLGLWLPQGSLGPWLKLQPLPASYFAVLPLLLLGYMALVQWAKRGWVRRHGWQ
ncbi:magnesium-translocating P-type ATPase [Ideonella sp. B7]|uniref:magnesium-translocating P-type ATPase n=1 Tax=Ideonella benzenivorans TaxID=2831643 RepID=UPI001CECAC0E|nr:magnesium-translocating P-type ATPase [Ideonella benzenivorans]MCA6215174.1 magnesium-translocating P-type ATPase [Ideonella benzenivorans]